MTPQKELALLVLGFMLRHDLADVRCVSVTFFKGRLSNVVMISLWPEGVIRRLTLRMVRNER